VWVKGHHGPSPHASSIQSAHKRSRSALLEFCIEVEADVGAWFRGLSAEIMLYHPLGIDFHAADAMPSPQPCLVLTFQSCFPERFGEQVGRKLRSFFRAELAGVPERMGEDTVALVLSDSGRLEPKAGETVHPSAHGEEFLMGEVFEKRNW
jgi:hypothetical protein